MSLMGTGTAGMQSLQIVRESRAGIDSRAILDIEDGPVDVSSCNSVSDDTPVDVSSCNSVSDDMGEGFSQLSSVISGLDTLN